MAFGQLSGGGGSVADDHHDEALQQCDCPQAGWAGRVGVANSTSRTAFDQNASNVASPTLARVARQGIVGVPTVSVTKALAHAQRTWRLTRGTPGSFGGVLAALVASRV